MPAGSFSSTPVYILDAVRTPIGSPFKSLKDLSASQLGASAVAGLLSRQKINSKYLSQVILGNTVMAGAGQNPARQSAILAGIPAHVPAYTVNQVCAGGLQSVILAAKDIALSHAELVIAGGMESATRTPQMFSKSVEAAFTNRVPVDSLIYDGLWCTLTGRHMGQLCEELAQKEKISRSAQDSFAFESFEKARAAAKEGKFANEIILIPLADMDDFKQDERLRRVSLESFRILPPAFRENGTITSGNASVPSDGAAAVLLAGKTWLKRQKSFPLARILGYASIAVQPQDVFTAAVPAVQACLKATRMKMQAIDLFEISEAFAAQAIYTREQLKIRPEKMNICGGDLALGHPLGAAGARILVTLIHALKAKSKRYGLAVICLGGGGAVALIVESLKGKV